MNQDFGAIQACKKAQKISQCLRVIDDIASDFYDLQDGFDWVHLK
jgi:hypothetical protein